MVGARQGPGRGAGCPFVTSVTTDLSPFLTSSSPSPAVVLHRGQLLGLRGESKVPAFCSQEATILDALGLRWPCLCLGCGSQAGPTPSLACWKADLPSGQAQRPQPLSLQPTRRPPRRERGPAPAASSMCMVTTAATGQPAASSPTAPWHRHSSASTATGMPSSSSSRCQVSSWYPPPHPEGCSTAPAGDRVEPPLPR